jgi:soluble lytic murein transglycosylase
MILAAFFALLFMGCSPDGNENITFVVITGDAPIQNVIQPTQIPPTATPYVDPQVALQIADRYLLNGFYENAVFSYQNILARGEDAPADIRAASAFGMGQAALREGLFQDAVDAMTILITQFPGDFRATQAYFMRGDAYLGLSLWEQAIADFKQYLVLRPGWIDSYVYERIGDAEVALQQFSAAYESYAQATNANRSLAPQLALREKVARLDILSGDVDSAIVQYDAILAVAENAPYRAEIEYRAAEALLDAGNINAALPRLQRIIDTYETTPQALNALNVLLDNGVPVDSYKRGRIYYFSGDYESAIEAFNIYTTQQLLDAIPAEFHLLLGRSYREIGNFDAAEVAFQTLIDQRPTDPLFGEAVLEIGRTRFLAGDIDAAIGRYLQIADTYGYLPETAADALWRAGYLYGTQGNISESRTVFVRLADTYPNQPLAIDGLFIAATAALNAGDTVGAESLYGRLAATTSGQDRAEAFLQVGRLALLRGDQGQANAAFTEAISAAPDSYFSARAKDIVAGVAPFTPPSEYVFEFDELTDITEAENWLRSRFGVTQEGPLWPLSPELEADPHIVRGRELWTFGLFDDAETEFLDVLDMNEGNALASYQLAIFFRIMGAYLPSQVGAANVINLADVATLDAPAYIARIRYPVYYRDVILDVSSKYGIDPLLLFSLARYESLFNTNATAAAGEKGLTQVIPTTAEYIADELNWPDYQHADLFRPYAGIEFGAYYLDEQLERFNQNTYASLAGYNAGPGRAIQWLDISGGDPDLFMSTINISSVKTYIQRIYSNYAIYRELYGR